MLCVREIPHMLLVDVVAASVDRGTDHFWCFTSGALKYGPHVIRAIFFDHRRPKVSLVGVVLRVQS